MTAYRAIPLLRPLIALILGIYLGFEYPNGTTIYMGIGLMLLVIFLFSYRFFSFERKIKLSSIAGMAILVSFFLLGYISVRLKDDSQKTNWMGKIPAGSHTWVLVLSENPSRKSKSFLTQANAVSILIQDKFYPTTGIILLHLDTSLQNQCHFNIGDTLIIQTNIKPIQTPANADFDVATYYKRQQIQYQASVYTNNLQTFSQDHSYQLSSILQTSQKWILQKLSTHIHQPENLGLAEALLIGYKEDFDKTLYNSYRDAGIIHIIAISGMHLLLLYELLKATAFLFIKNIQARKWIQLGCLIFIWLFAFLTGAGPSVIRAAVMLTSLVLGEVFYRNTQSLNSLVASAFLLLLFMPEWIWNVGFWLSYMAVLGILLFYKPLLIWLDFENKILRYVWSSIAVTLAAQILTLPILMYCFGKIPVYFLFTNLLMVPLSSIILYGLVIILAFNWFAPLANIVGTITEQLISWMNSFVRYVAQYPFANISISINALQMGLLYIIIGIISYLIFRKMELKDMGRG